VFSQGKIASSEKNARTCILVVDVDIRSDYYPHILAAHGENKMRTPMNYRVSIRRGANMVNANPQRMGTPSKVPGARWATGRNVKCSVGFGRFDIAESWTLKMRMEDGSVRVVAQHLNRETAAAFVAGEERSFW
jgi:uncharacterized protein (DUF1800 family)